VRVLFVCFANICRSPVAAATLSRDSRGAVDVVSRGLAGGPDDLPGPLASALESAGLAVSRPVGVALTPADVAAADVCLFMERRLLREVVVAEPTSWPRSFTLREFARRAMDNAPGDDDHVFQSWLRRVHTGRSSADLLGADDRDDVLDPGLTADEAGYAQMIATVSSAVAAVTPFLTSWPSTSES
jgi:protein-tyrosine-phosphatase